MCLLFWDTFSIEQSVISDAEYIATEHSWSCVCVNVAYFSFIDITATLTTGESEIVSWAVAGDLDG